MSLSPQECTAGISFRALETLRKNGNGHALPAFVGDGTKETTVVDTPYRRLSILESRTGEISLRDVSFVGAKADVELIHLEREQAQTLVSVLRRML